MPEWYLVYSGNNTVNVFIQYREFYKVSGTDGLMFIAGHFRIMDFLPKDSFYKKSLACLPAGCDQYWLMEASVLHKFLDLILWMRKNGYNDSAISINHGYRHPTYNKEVGGAGKSHHMQGEAIDIKVGDIDRNGIADSNDKKILLAVLENDIIKENGGLGLYPKSDVIHMDTRGYKARWDSH